MQSSSVVDLLDNNLFYYFLLLSTKAAKMADPRNASSLINPWDVQLGRIDSDQVGPSKVPRPGAGVEDINGYFLALDAKPGGGGFLAPRAPFWEKVTGFTCCM